jgi:protein-S-isoprenylcysteine O-methyltransferase Ste14
MNGHLWISAPRIEARRAGSGGAYWMRMGPQAGPLPTAGGGRGVQAATVQLLSVLVGGIHGGVWVLLSRWERPGRTARLRARLPSPPLAVRGGYLALLVPLLYPVIVVVAPRWAYDGWLNWSSRIDGVLQRVGLGLWVAGMLVLVWAGGVLRRYMDVDGVAENHELVTVGPYRYVRHPVYGSFTAIALGLGLLFRSYLITGVAVAWLAASVRWAAAEEALLASPEGLGATYRSYSERTGRFLPRLRQVRR